MNESFQRERNVEVDLLDLTLKSERRAWLVAGASSIMAVFLGCGLAVVGALRTSVPYVFEVDKSSGAVQMVSVGDENFRITNQELVDKHNLQRYVSARESYFYKLLQQDYETVVSMSTEEVGLEYARVFDGPDALDRKLGASETRKINIISISLSDDSGGFNRATVRFARTRQSIGRNPERPDYFIANLAFEYKPVLFGKEKELVKNPLGFKVTQYRVDPENAPADTVLQVTQASPAGAMIPAPR